MQIESNVELSRYTSWLMGGSADFFCLPTTLDEVKEAQEWAQQKKLAMTILGGGSNVLVSDQGVRGLVCCLRRFSGTQVEEKAQKLHIQAKAGTAKSEILKIFLKHKLPPALFLAGLPGDVGGGVVMNAGVAEAFVPREFGEIVEWIEVLKPDGSLKKYAHDEITWNYRHSLGWQPGILVNVGLVVPAVEDSEVLEKVKQANRIRLSKQPLDMPSCGSVFRNPPGHKAAQLIDFCGLKGFRVGDAQVSLKHANFIVNLGNAKACDTWQVITIVKGEVFKKTKVELQTEVIRLGQW